MDRPQTRASSHTIKQGKDRSCIEQLIPVENTGQSTEDVEDTCPEELSGAATSTYVRADEKGVDNDDGSSVVDSKESRGTRPYELASTPYENERVDVCREADGGVTHCPLEKSADQESMDEERVYVNNGSRGESGLSYYYQVHKVLANTEDEVENPPELMKPALGRLQNEAAKAKHQREAGAPMKRARVMLPGILPSS